jgi:hypothetical protein
MKTKVHWNIFKGQWTVRTYKGCARHKEVLVKNWKTEVKPNYKDNPRGWVYADHTDVIVNPEKSLVKTLAKKEQLLYDKYKMFFNITEGDMLLCNDDGCFIVEPTNA